MAAPASPPRTQTNTDEANIARGAPSQEQNYIEAQRCRQELAARVREAGDSLASRFVHAGGVRQEPRSAARDLLPDLEAAAKE